ncbi:putative Major facilitator superfamily (MFS) profile domain-containing protein [Seiridium unicorne]|uniref:Major facilitator superfamily (MFS) profile domain-containing protein n=1 Tax=Seiridium unicorne TaxID=138068 RepID=A0ABR2UTY8_9PEZI
MQSIAAPAAADFQKPQPNSGSQAPGDVSESHLAAEDGVRDESVGSSQSMATQLTEMRTGSVVPDSTTSEVNHGLGSIPEFTMAPAADVNNLTVSSSEPGIGVQASHLATTDQIALRGDDGPDPQETASHQNNTTDTALSSSTTIRGTESTSAAPSINASSASSKGKAPMRASRPRSFQVRLQRSRLYRLKHTKTAAPGTVKAEIVEQSAVNQEKLARFSRVLASPGYRIELFGKEIPLSRLSLVRVKEARSAPTDYICVHGLRTAADITKFHTVMSQERYRASYRPLRLCYDTDKISKVGSPDLKGSESLGQGYLKSLRPGDSGSLKPTNYGALSPTIEPEEISSGGLQSFYQYHPVADDDTYCGALFRTSVDGQPWISTIGGTIELGGDFYVMACQHTSSQPISPGHASVADTLVEKDFADDVERPLVFLTENLPGSSDVVDIIDAEQDIETEGIAATLPKEKWRELSVKGVIKVGPEWCLVPIEDHSMLPNFVRRPEKGTNGTNHSERQYIEKISEPYGGCPAFIASAADTASTGRVTGNRSYIVGGGTAELLEVWTVLLDEEQMDIRRGDSGSWVLDISDPEQFRVLGSAVATSPGSAYFVRLADQFQQISELTEGKVQLSLASSFRALVNCANLAFRNHDDKSDYYVEEALSPQTLVQMYNGWYLRGLKEFLEAGNDIEKRSKDSPNTRQTKHAIVNIVKSLVLRYGTSFLDGLLDPEAWLRQYGGELLPSQKQVYGQLNRILQPWREGEMTGKKATDPDPVEQQDFMKMISDSYPPRDAGSLELGQSRLPRTDQGSFGLLFSPRPGGLSPFALLVVLPMLGVGCLAGFIAAMVLDWYGIDDGHVSSSTDLLNTVGLGAASGVIATSVWILQILLVYLFNQFDWRLFIGTRVSETSTRAKFLIFASLSITSSFARTMLPTLYIIRKQEIQDQGAMLSASAAAAGISILSASSPTISWFILKLRYDNVRTHGRTTLGLPIDTVIARNTLYMMYCIFSVGFDAVAGYTFMKVLFNSGLDLQQPVTGAITAAIFGSLTMLWPIISIINAKSFARPIIMWYRRRMLLRNYGPETVEINMISRPQVPFKTTRDNFELRTQKSDSLSVPSRVKIVPPSWGIMTVQESSPPSTSGQTSDMMRSYGGSTGYTSFSSKAAHSHTAPGALYRVPELSADPPDPNRPKQEPGLELSRGSRLRTPRPPPVPETFFSDVVEYLTEEPAVAYFR